jgi:hypothetical protein
MGKEVETTKQEAMDLLRKWMAEHRVIHLNMKSSAGLAKIVGRIDGVTDQEVAFSAKQSNYSLGEYNLARFPLENCSFEYSDSKDAPEWLSDKLLGYDALLYIYYLDAAHAFRGAIGLAVLPVEEWPQF